MCHEQALFFHSTLWRCVIFTFSERQRQTDRLADDAFFLYLLTIFEIAYVYIAYQVEHTQTHINDAQPHGSWSGWGDEPKVQWEDTVQPVWSFCLSICVSDSDINHRNRSDLSKRPVAGRHHSSSNVSLLWLEQQRFHVEQGKQEKYPNVRGKYLTMVQNVCYVFKTKTFKLYHMNEVFLGYIFSVSRNKNTIVCSVNWWFALFLISY